MVYSDVSKYFDGSTYYGRSVAVEILKREGGPEAIKYFAEKCDPLTDYEYWFFLSTLWVSYTCWSDLNLWKHLFSSERPKRVQSIMKPSEYKAFQYLPYHVKVYRAHRQNEKDWIAYTLNVDIARRFAKERGVSEIKEYRVKKRDILALFLRRGEDEVIILNKNKVELVRTINLTD